MTKLEVKQIFFDLLTEDEEFRKKLTEFILNAVAEKFVEKVAQVEEPPQIAVAEPESEQKNSTEEFAENVAKLVSECDKLNGQLKTVRGEKESAEGERDRLKADLNKLRDEKTSVENERDRLKADLSNLRNEKNSVEGERDRLKTDLSNLRNEKNSVEDERDRLKTDLNNLRSEKASVEGERDRLKADLNNLRNEKASVEGERVRLQIELETLRTEKNSVEGERDNLKQQLAERFADGWELYQKFLSLDISTRENSGLRAESFMSFICSGAQMKRLEGIWESALDSKRAGKFDDAEILWSVFAYCVRLVNAAQGDNIIEILNTQLGERYDTDKHSTSGTNSSTQGVVREIILVGYRNNISRKVVKKSNVRVG